MVHKKDVCVCDKCEYGSPDVCKRLVENLYNLIEQKDTLLAALNERLETMRIIIKSHGGVA